MDRVYWEIVDAKKSWRVYQDGCCGDLEEAKEEVAACFKDASFGNYKVRYYEARWLEESLVEKWE